MKLIVTRCQVAKNIWLTCSECTSTLPPVQVIGVDENPPEGAIIFHFLCTEDDVRRARKDMLSQQIVGAACVGRDEDMYPTPGTIRMIGELRSEFGEDRIFHCPETLFDWVRQQLTPVPA